MMSCSPAAAHCSSAEAISETGDVHVRDELCPAPHLLWRAHLPNSPKNVFILRLVFSYLWEM